jgi:citrate synthase
MTDTKGTAKLSLDGKDYEFNVRKGSVGPDVIDVSKLYGQTGAFTYDPGFTSTASCESKITYIDGDEGILMYRGYPIDELAEHGDFIETCYLLLYGNLPTASERKEFETAITYHTMIHEQMQRFFAGFRRDAHPMAVMVGVVGAMSAFYHDSTDISDPVQREIAARRMIAKMPTIAAGLQVSHRPAVRLSAQRPRLLVQLPAHVLCRAVRGVQGQPDPVARHGPHLHSARRPRAERVDLNGAPGRLIRRQPVCLHRRRHCLPVGPGARRRQRGCAQHAERNRQPDRIPEFIDRAKDKEDPFRLMGFGHRVYKNYDPRAKIMQKTAHEVLNELGITDDPLLDVARSWKPSR